MKKIIVIYTFSPFPSGDANANRIYAMALSMQSFGYKVIVLTNTSPNQSDFNSETGQYVFNTIEYRSYYKPELKRIKRITNRYNIKRILESNLEPFERENIYLICTSYLNYNFFLHSYLKMRKLPVLVDVTEWYCSFQFKFGRLTPKFILHDLTNRFLIPRAKNIICISKYLENYYKTKGCNTIYLPPQIAIKDYAPHSLPVLSPIIFFYAGSIQRNDPIGIALEGFTKLTVNEKEKIKIIIAGCDENTFKKILHKGNEIIENLGNSLTFLGKISKSEVQKYLSKVHFMFFIRPVARYSSAGFPSKVPEALASGVPVITNLTSDLDNYIFELYNGLKVEEFSVKAFESAVRRALNLTNNEFQVMSQNAHNTAKTKFDYAHYNEILNEYLDRII